MDNQLNFNGWDLIKNLLVVFEFSDNQIKQVEFDLNRLIQIEVITSLFTDMSDGTRNELEAKLKTLAPEEVKNELKTLLTGVYSEQDIDSRIATIANEIIGDYLKNMLAKVTDPVKQDKITDVMAKLATI